MFAPLINKVACFYISNILRQRLSWNDLIFMLQISKLFANILLSLLVYSTIFKIILTTTIETLLSFKLFNYVSLILSIFLRITLILVITIMLGFQLRSIFTLFRLLFLIEIISYLKLSLFITLKVASNNCMKLLFVILALLLTLIDIVFFSKYCTLFIYRECIFSKFALILVLNRFLFFITNNWFFRWRLILSYT